MPLEPDALRAFRAIHLRNGKQQAAPDNAGNADGQQDVWRAENFYVERRRLHATSCRMARK